MISIHGKMLVKSLRDTILETYGLRLKVHQGFSMGQTAEDSATVGSLEGRFKSDYGLYVQVCVMRDGKPTYTGSNLDGTTLSDLDRRAAEKGREVFQYAAQ